jgi:hypothetical protein
MDKCPSVVPVTFLLSRFTWIYPRKGYKPRACLIWVTYHEVQSYREINGREGQVLTNLREETGPSYETS